MATGRLEEAVDRFIIDTGIAHGIIHGNDTQIIETDGGPVDSFAKAIKDAQETAIDIIVDGGDSLLSQVQVYVDEAREYRDEAGEIAVGNFIGDDSPPAPVLVYSTFNLSGSDDPAKGAALLRYNPPIIQGNSRSQAEKNAENITINDFGEVGTGGDDTPVFIAARDWANTNGIPVRITPGAYSLTQNVSGNFMKDMGAYFTGTGYVRLNHTNTPKLGQRQIHIDMTVQPGAYTETATLNNYKTLNEFAGISIVSNVFDGYQGALSTDSGARTNFPVFHTSGSFSGEGDSICFFASRGISRHPRWEQVTGSWTGQNSIQLFAGHAGANTGNVNIYGAEFSISDNGPGKPDVSGIGLVISLNRNDGTANLRQTWQGIRLQAGRATVTPDCGLNMSSTWKNGIDLTGADFTGAAIALKAGQRIYLNCDATSPAGSWYCGQNGTSLNNQYIDAQSNRIRLVSNTGVDLYSNDESASAGPDFRLLRDSASPANNDTLGRVMFSGKDSANAVTNYASITTIATNVTPATKNGSLWLQTMQAGSFATRVRIDNGMVVGATASGGDRGTGTINLQSSLFVQGVQVVSARKTGWVAATGTSSRDAFATNTVTLEQLAQRFKALQEDLIAHGLIGA